MDQLEEARRLFVENLTGTLQVVAKDVKVQVEFDREAVAFYRLIGYENRRLAKEQFADDRVDAGEVGAQDDLGKPYRLRELLARVGALVRRGGGSTGPQALRFAGYRMDLDQRRVESPEGRPVELTRTEFDLLAFFVRERERVLRRDEILDAVWGRDVVVDPHTVDNFVSSLKRKLGWSTASRFRLQTVPGVGYCLEVEG